jgi:hypothetical protein
MYICGFSVPIPCLPASLPPSLSLSHTLSPSPSLSQAAATHGETSLSLFLSLSLSLSLSLYIYIYIYIRPRRHTAGGAFPRSPRQSGRRPTPYPARQVFFLNFKMCVCLFVRVCVRVCTRIRIRDGFIYNNFVLYICMIYVYYSHK